MRINGCRKKNYIWILSTVLFCVFLAAGCEKKSKTIAQIAYDKLDENSVIYLKEEDAMVPYLVLTSDYQGNVLLLRKDLLPNMMPYKENDNVGWTSYEYASFYEESSIDQFLNTEFLDSLGKDVRDKMVKSTIEVTDKDSYFDGDRITHTISRDVFLLSAEELNLNIKYTAVVEGTPLKCFKGKYDKKVAYLPDGSRCAYWTRTPDLWETFTVLTVGYHGCGSGAADIQSGVRPAFCMNKDTVIKESDDIIEGQTVYIIE